jgi:hypothetical protein
MQAERSALGNAGCFRNSIWRQCGLAAETPIRSFWWFNIPIESGLTASLFNRDPHTVHIGFITVSSRISRGELMWQAAQ